MDRRSFLAALGLTVVDAGRPARPGAPLRPTRANAGRQQPYTRSCTGLGPMREEDNYRQYAKCRVDLNTGALGSPVARRGRDDEHTGTWCWAACISGIFAYYGRRVSQERIMDTLWHRASNPPEYGPQIMAALTRSWTDDAGGTFQARGGVFDVQELKARTLSDELAYNNPVIINVNRHPALLTHLRYYKYNGEYGQVTLEPRGDTFMEPWSAAYVWDPWPDSPGERRIDRYTFNQIVFAAGIRVG